MLSSLSGSSWSVSRCCRNLLRKLGVLIVFCCFGCLSRGISIIRFVVCWRGLGYYFSRLSIVISVSFWLVLGWMGRIILWVVGLVSIRVGCVLW